MTAFQWEREVQEDLVRIEAIMDEVLHTNVSLLKDMARYIVDSGGKRLRPGVNMTVYRAFGGIDHHVQSRLAAAFEILHTGTLVHDDINDCSTLRRGREAVHVKYGLQNAIVCGDFMFAKSFLIAARHSHEVIERLLETCIGLAEGEILQRKWIDGESLTVNDRMDIIDMKTAIPIGAMAWAGAHNTDEGRSVAQRAFDYGLNLGRAFQLKDDLMDFLGDPGQTGKPLLQDLEQGNITLPITFALENLETGKSVELRGMIEDHKNADVKRLVYLLESSGALDFIKKKMDIHTDIALESIKAFPDNRFADSLINIVEYVSNREC